MLTTTEGIVLRTVKFRDTSLIADVFTRTLGLKTYIINGVFRNKPKYAPSMLELGCVLDMVVYNREGKNINRVKELKSAIYPNLSIGNIHRLAVKMFIVELTRKTIRTDEVQMEIYDFLRSCIWSIEDSSKSFSNIHLYYMVCLLDLVGLSPDLSDWPKYKILHIQEGRLIAEEPEIGMFIPSHIVASIIELLQGHKEHLEEVKLGKEQRRAIIEHLMLYYIYHIDKFPHLNTYSIYKQLL
jgi:DNA repair protein RecO (recombination protein O)